MPGLCKRVIMAKKYFILKSNYWCLRKKTDIWIAGIVLFTLQKCSHFDAKEL